MHCTASGSAAQAARLTVPCRVLDSIKGDIGRRVGRQDVTLAKKGGAARGKKKWLVTALFSNQEVDRYFILHREWVCLVLGGRSWGLY